MVKENNLFLQELIKQSPVAIQIMTPDGRIMKANKAFERLWGVNLNKYNIFKDEQVKNLGLMPYIKKGFAGETLTLPPFEYESSKKKSARKGRKHWIQSLIYPLKDENGKIMNVVMLHEDITERKQTEEELQESKEKYRMLFNEAPIGIAISTTEGKIIDANKAQAKMMGCAVEELKGKNVNEYYVYPEKRKEMIKLFMEAGEVRDFEMELRKKDGSIIVELINLNRIKKGSKEYIFATGRNITERKQAEEALRTSEAKLSNAMEIAKLGYWEYDVNQDIFTFNDYFYGIFRTTAEKVGGYKMSSKQYARQFVHPDDMEVVANETKKAIDTKDPSYNQQLEHRIIYADGETGYISVRFFIEKDNYGRIVKAYGTNQDITEHKRVENALKNSRRMLQTVLDAIPVGVFWKDCNFIYLGANRTWLSAAGLKSSTEAIGLSDYDLPWSKEEADSFRKDDKRIMESGLPEYDIIEPFLQADGTHAWAKTNKVPLLDSEGKVIGILGTYEDITQQKKAEEALANRKAELRSLLEGSTDSVYAIDEDYRYIFVNDAHLSHMVDSRRISQKRSEKLIGKKYQDFHPKTESEKFLENIKKVFETGKPVRYEFKWPATERWSNRVLSPIKDIKTGKVKSVSVISRDITEPKRIENALNDSRRMLQTVLDTLPVGVFWKDRNSIYLGANRTWLSAAGLKSSKEVIGKNGYDLPWSKEEADSFRKDDKRIMKSGLPEYDIIQPFLQADGTHSWAKTNKVPLLDSEDKVIGILGTYEDITQQKKAEEALANREAELRSLLKGSNDSVYAIDEDYRYIFVNDAHLSHMVDSGRISQKRSEKLIGKKYQDFHPKTESEKFLENIKKVFETGKPVRYEFKWPATERWSNRVLSPIKDIKTGKVKSVSVISRNITQQKKAEEEKEKYQSMLLQSQKMEAIGTLAGGIAHDFNNILSSIKGYIQLCLEDVVKETQTYNNLEQVLIATDRAKSLVSQILAFSRQSKHKMKPVQVSQIVEEVTKLLMSTIPTKIKIRKQLKTKKDIVLADSTEIHQVLLNLCTNAVQAMQEKGGILEISLTNVRFDSKELAEYSHITREFYVKLSLRDTGCGMDPITVSRIFEPFFTTKKQNKGTGLGLAVVHGIIQEHNGIITVKSKPGQGTTFHIYLPELKQKKQHKAEDQKQI